jgi:hypothetical protein
LDEWQAEKRDESKAYDFMSNLKKSFLHSIDTDHKLRLNKLCYIEDWNKNEIKKVIYELQNASLASYILRKDWTIPKGKKIVSMRRPGFIHRKDWNGLLE